MPVSGWSTDPASNTYLGTFNLQEGATLIGDLNGVVRQMMADVRVMYDGVPVAADYLRKDGGALTGDITRAGRGAYLHWAGDTQVSGRVFAQAAGSALPTGAQEGDLLIEY